MESSFEWLKTSTADNCENEIKDLLLKIGLDSVIEIVKFKMNLHFCSFSMTALQIKFQMVFSIRKSSFRYL